MAHYHTIISKRNVGVMYGGILELDPTEILKQRLKGEKKYPKTICKTKMVKSLTKTMPGNSVSEVCFSMIYHLRNKAMDGDIVTGVLVRAVKHYTAVYYIYTKYIPLGVQLR